MWVRIDDSFTDNPKILSLSDAGLRLYLVGLCYSARLLTDGYVPVRAITGQSPTRVRELIRRGLWSLAPDGEGYLIHDWHEYNPPAETVRQRRKAEAERQARSRASRRDSRRD